MQEIEKIKNSEEVCFHFTDNDKIDSIMERGLLALNDGKNSRVTGREKPAVFFSKGFRGTLGTVNRFLINISRAPESINREYYAKEFPDLLRIYEENKGSMDWVYMIAHKYFKDKTYLELDLTGVSKDDYEKLSDEEKEQIDYIIDDINFENSERQTIRNMHTIEGKGVAKDKINHIEGDAISTLIKMHELFQKEHPGEDILEPEEWENRTIPTNLITGFIEYEKELLEQSKETTENELINQLKEQIVTNEQEYLQKVSGIKSNDKTEIEIKNKNNRHFTKW